MPHLPGSPRLWFSLLFLSAVVTVPLAYRSLRRAVPPRSIGDLAARAESQLGLHAVAAAQTDKGRCGMYLCREDGHSWLDLPHTRIRQFVREWRGVVLLTPAPAADKNLCRTVEEWGDAGALIGNVLVFGDPALVAEIIRLASS